MPLFFSSPSVKLCPLASLQHRAPLPHPQPPPDPRLPTNVSTSHTLLSPIQTTTLLQPQLFPSPPLLDRLSATRSSSRLRFPSFNLDDQSRISWLGGIAAPATSTSAETPHNRTILSANFLLSLCHTETVIDRLSRPRYPYRYNNIQLILPARNERSHRRSSLCHLTARYTRHLSAK